MREILETDFLVAGSLFFLIFLSGNAEKFRLYGLNLHPHSRNILFFLLFFFFFFLMHIICQCHQTVSQVDVFNNHIRVIDFQIKMTEIPEAGYA